MHTLWTGSISFGLVNIPVNLYSGVNPHEGIDFDMLHKKDGGQIRYARICKKDGQEVPWDEIVKGYEYAEGDYIELTDKDFAAADAKKTQTIDIQQFVEEGDIDIRYFDKPYYLEPQKGGDKAYALLHAALEKTNKVGLVKFVMHQREHLGVLKPVGRALVLNQMRFPTDLREGTDLHFPSHKEVSGSELEMAEKLVKQGTKPFVPEDFHDTYTEELEEIIKAKTKGKKSTEKTTAAPEKTAAKDLMSALKASLSADKK